MHFPDSKMLRRIVKENFETKIAKMSIFEGSLQSTAGLVAIDIC